MRTIKFRPLRVVKKTGKITVASYIQWRSIKTADYNNFTLAIDESYKLLNDEDFVYRHDGKQLFFYGYNPCNVTNYSNIEVDELVFRQGNNFISNQGNGWIIWHLDGCDCDGVPTFSHYDADYIVSDHTRDFTVFEPLTVGMVKMWFGWFLWSLDNSRLQVVS